MTRLSLLLSLTSLLPAADLVLTPGVTTVNQFTSAGVLRSVRIHAPSGYAPGSPLPVVLCFHGGGSTAQEQETLSGFSAKADAVGCLVAYPDGWLDPVSNRRNFADGRGTTPAEVAGIDDVAFTRDLIDRLAAATAIDRLRIYATGISNGGLMSQRLGLQLGTRIAAIAPVAANLAQPLASGFAPPVPVAVIAMSGTADAFMPYAGGSVSADLGQVTGAEAAAALWVAADGCATTPVVTDPFGIANASDGCTAVRRLYPAGPTSAGVEVAFISITGGGHTWPGSVFNPPALGATCLDFSATNQMWDFFVQHPKRSPAVMTDATAVPSAGGHAQMSVAATDDGGAANLIYTWTASGPGTMTFTPNGSSAASAPAASATANGTYAVTVSIRDADGNTSTSTTTVTIVDAPGGGGAPGPNAGATGGSGCGAGGLLALLTASGLLGWRRRAPRT